MPGMRRRFDIEFSDGTPFLLKALGILLFLNFAVSYAIKELLAQTGHKLLFVPTPFYGRGFCFRATRSRVLH
jgi:hypothetical protein